jgi:cyclic pyranopterin phosphate synthase
MRHRNVPMSEMMDSFGRTPKKLRISVTDRCNMRCLYCMPQECISWYPRSKILSYEEITRLTGIFAGLGIEKIRLTGGEPLVRPKIEKLVSSLSKIDGIKRLSMTTNGLLLRDKVEQLKRAGLQNVNVSLDTLMPAKFKSITGVDGLSRVQASLQAAHDHGLEVKINTLVIRGWNDDELEAFAEFALVKGYSVRFIEFMPLDGSHIWIPSLVVTKEEMINRLSRSGIDLLPLNNDPSDPARLYSLKCGRRTIGFIPSMSEPFCGACDRLRITSDGKFLTCLFEPPAYDLKQLLRNGKSDKEIETYMIDCYKKKPKGLTSIIENKNLMPKLKNLMNTVGG